MRAPVGANIVVAVLLIVANARADRRAAAQHFDRGRALYAETRYDEALAAFQSGHRAHPLRGFLVNIGQCHRKLQQLDEAAQAWREFLDSRPSDARLRGEVEEALAEVDAERARRVRLAAIAPPPPSREDEIAPAPVENPLLLATPPGEPPRARARMPRWGWALIGVVAAGALAAAVGVGVTQAEAAQNPRAGSLGVIDGRR